MSDWATIYAVVFLVAFLKGQPDKWVAAVMAVNFAGSVLIGPSLLLVGIVDLACIAVLVGKSRTANIVAALYVLMLPVYVASSAIGWSGDTTGAIIELIGYVQIAVMANVLGGMAGRLGAFTGWRAVAAGYLHRGQVASREFVAQRPARDTAPHRKIGR